ncbi:MAG: hypothetical protein JWO38_7576 [Gemmataceae bacterium]|nr:hypothetical protein [Gemmataceae bacterium]
MSHRSLRIVAAYHALGMASTDQLVNSADDALNDGVYSYSLGELATFRNPTWADCSPLFVAALRELQIPFPEPAAAIGTLLEFHVIRMVEGVASPGEALHDLYSIDLAFRYDPPVKLPPAALEPLRPFIDRYYAIEEYHGVRSYREEQALPQLEDDSLDRLHTEVLSFADDWSRSRWGMVLDPSWFTSDVLALARGVLSDGAFDRLPILADAVQEAGCGDEDILDHLRKDGPHLRGCFVVDLLLGREPGGTNR